jgi:hypothetical protein
MDEFCDANFNYTYAAMAISRKCQFFGVGYSDNVLAVAQNAAFANCIKQTEEDDDNYCYLMEFPTNLYCFDRNT